MFSIPTREVVKFESFDNDQLSKILVGFQTNYQSQTFKPDKKPLGLPSIRFGFIRLHKLSMSNRYFYSLSYRLKCFPGSASHYLLCLS